MGNLFTHFDVTRFLFLNDLLLGPIYIFILYSLANKYAKRQGGIYAKYFTKGLVARIVGCILTALMYQYYYKGGDTFVYFLYTLKNKNIMDVNMNVFIDAVFKFKHD